MKKIRSLPTLFALFIILSGMAAGVFLISRSSTWLTQAGSEITPKEIKITNLADTSFTVSWITDGLSLGLIKYSNNSSLSSVATDDRDRTEGIEKKYLTHHVTIKNLQPNTNYLFKISSEGKLFDDNGQTYQKTTGPQINQTQPADDITGNILKGDGLPASDAIVYLSLAGAFPQSTVVNNSGSWSISLNQTRSADLNRYATYDRQSDIEELFVQGGNQGIATAIVTANNDHPLPPITLGQNLDFRNLSTETDTNAIDSVSSKFTFEALSAPAQPSEEIIVINPSEGESINTAKPAIMGTAPAGASLNITLESTQKVTQIIKADQNGNWEWVPSQNLEPGNHTLTIKFSNEDGVLQTIIRNFTVLAASSSLPAIEASPSATPTGRPSLTPAPTATPSEETQLTSTESGLPQPGNLIPTISFFIIGIGLFVVGILSLI